MAVATDEDRKFLSEQGFDLIGSGWAHADGRQINSVMVYPGQPSVGTFYGGQMGCPQDRVVMWHAAVCRVRHLGDYMTAYPVGTACETPTACFIQAELNQWGM